MYGLSTGTKGSGSCGEVAVIRGSTLVNREIKIHVYAKRQTSDSSWEFLRIENKQIKTVQNNSYV